MTPLGHGFRLHSIGAVFDSREAHHQKPLIVLQYRFEMQVKKISRSRYPRYMEIVDQGTRKYAHDEAVLADEILVLLVTYRELTRSRLCVMVGANGPIAATVLNGLMNSSLVVRNRRPDSRGQSYLFWSAVDGAVADPRFSAASILEALQRSAADRSQ